ncbi:hypothetical protein RR46_07000 [Papilio xuthus]|uniref:Uncharacterized protein n=1 Tax=Papilio xuthus TaxID=66420 RepID=A0A194Q5X6_PAPXU|nr:hypothetical protein RR46_07000 [Papilio xuthus]
MERDEFADHLLETFRKELIAKIEKMYHVNESGTLHPEILRKANNLRTGRLPNGFKSKQRFLRQGDPEEEFDKYLIHAVEVLDNHPILNSVLSVAERNDFKDMGFELAGQYIHSLIDSLKPSDLPLPSTQQPWGDNDNISITSQHNHATTIMESKEPLKKDPPVFERSIMLTRFKLSQQKRQLREKDNQELTQTSKKSPKSSKKQKQSPIKNKEKSQLNSGKNEFHPNKLKRNKIVNKIVLKPKNDLKVINWDGVKRKTYQTDIKSPNKKRKKSHKSSDSNEDISSLDYSELDIHEVIRMADQDLDDEDFMEILTCPSPVWWEDPPDDEHMEGPIVIRTNTLASMPDLAPEYRRKQARKRTPQKITIEECHNEIKTNPLQSNVINSKKSDIKFTNKRNKLENLLNTMKSKRKDSSKEMNIEKENIVMLHISEKFNV